MKPQELHLPRIKIFAQAIDRTQPRVDTSQQVCEYLRNCFDEINYRESFIMVCLTPDLLPIGYYEVSKGTTGSTLVDQFMICQIALLASSKYIIISHNHPGGSIRPSLEDDKATKKVLAALKMIDAKLIDHIILTETNFYSYADDGKI